MPGIAIVPVYLSQISSRAQVTWVGLGLVSTMTGLSGVKLSPVDWIWVYQTTHLRAELYCTMTERICSL